MTKRRKLLGVSAALAIGGMILGVLGILAVFFTTYPGVDIRRVSFGTGTYDSPPRTVSGLLLVPERKVRNPSPAVVFSHGMTVQKEMYLSQCRELARGGLVVLAIDLRGHGETGGTNDFGRTETHDVWAAADYLAQQDFVDDRRIGAVGHSLGGITSARAGALQDECKLSSVAAIYCWPGQKQAIELVFGPIEGFVGKLWPAFGMSRNYDLNDSEAMKERDVISLIDGRSPPNYLLVVGDADQLGSVRQARDIIKAATGLANIEDNRTYGSFSDGTARRLEVTGDNHLTEATNSEVLEAVADWFFESFGLQAIREVGNPSLLRYLGWGAVLAGFLLISLATVFFIRSRRSEQDRQVPPYSPDGRSASVTLAVVSAALFAAVSVAAFPFSNATNVRAFVPFFGADVFTTLVASRTILLIPCVVLVMLLVKLEGWNALPLGLERRYSGDLRSSLLLGLAPAAVFVALYAPVAHGLLLPRGYPASMGWFTVLAMVLFVQLWAEQLYFHYFLMPAFAPLDTPGRRATYVLWEAGVRGFSFGLAFVPVLASPLLAIGRPDMALKVHALPAIIIGGVLVFLPISTLAFYARRRGYNVLAPCLAVALFVALFFTCFVSVRAF